MEKDRQIKQLKLENSKLKLKVKELSDIAEYFYQQSIIKELEEELIENAMLANSIYEDSLTCTEEVEIEYITGTIKFE